MLRSFNTLNKNMEEYDWFVFTLNLSGFDRLEWGATSWQQIVAGIFYPAKFNSRRPPSILHFLASRLHAVRATHLSAWPCINSQLHLNCFSRISGLRRYGFYFCTMSDSQRSRFTGSQPPGRKRAHRENKIPGDSSHLRNNRPRNEKIGNACITSASSRALSAQQTPTKERTRNVRLQSLESPSRHRHQR